MSKNSLEFNGNDKMIDEVIKHAMDPLSPMDDIDRERAVKILNERMEVIKTSISQFEKEKEDLMAKREALDGKLDATDDEKAEADSKIIRLEAEIRQEGIDLNDASHPLVRRLNSAKEERSALEDLSVKYQSDSRVLEERKTENDETLENLSSEMRQIEKAKELISQKMVDFKKNEAEHHAKERAKGITGGEQNPFLILFDSLIVRHHNEKERKRQVDEALKKELTNQQKIEARYSVKDANAGIIEEEKVSPKDETCFSVITSEKGGDSKVKVMTSEEYVAYMETEEAKALRETIQKEQDLPDDEKTLSVVVSTHDSREDLLNKLEPIVKSGIDNAQNIGQYATSQSRRESLVAAIATDAVKSEGLGGNALDDVFKGKMTAKDDQDITPTGFARREQPNLKIQSAVESGHEMRIDDEDIPWKQLTNFNLTKASLSKENLEALRGGGMTNLITITGKNLKGEEVKRSFKLSLTNDSDGKLAFRKLPVLPLENIDKRTKIGDIEFNQKDKDMLKKYGQLNHLVPFTSEDGKTRNLMVGLDKETNTLFSSDPNKVRLPKFISEQCTKDELRRIRNCEPVHLESLKDNAGQKFSGWVVLSPYKNGQLLQLKHVDNEFKAQVMNNNFGERTELLKQDKDPMVVSKQIEPNDGENKQESFRKAMDFSTDSEGTIEHDKTIKTTRHL